ncbi:MAG: phage virion morphogenesis protein [Cyanobacteria bacterium J06648_11]
MVSVSFDSNALEISADVQNAARSLLGLSVPMQTIALHLEAETKLNFQRQSDPDGTQWPPLAESTLRRRRNRRSSQILVDTGTLRSSIASRFDATSAEVGTNIEYGIYHQRDTRKIPRRRFLGFTARTELFVLKTLSDAIVEELAG